MAEETLTTGQADTTPASQSPAAGTGTAPADNGQTQAPESQAADTANATDTAQAADGAKTEDAKPTPKAPEQYADFTVPEGYTLQGELGDEFKAIAKELDLTQEQAQKLINLDVKRGQAIQQETHKASAEWLAQTQADKEIGGTALTENVALAKKALDTFGTPELKTLLQQSGLGNHPEIIRAFYRAGKAISEDSFVPGGTSSQAPGDPAKTLFPNHA